MAGVSNKNVTQGIPRLKELINTVKHIKTPSMTLKLKDSSREDSPEVAALVANQITQVILKDVVESSSVVCDPVPCDQGSSPDRGWAPLEYALAAVIQNEKTNNATDWMLRLQLQREVLRNKKLKVDDVANALRHSLGEEVLCVCSDDNDDQLVIHVRMQKPSEHETAVSDNYFLRFLEANILDGILLRGASGVLKAYVEKEPKLAYDSESGCIVNSVEPYIETEGINLLEAFLAEDVDSYSVTCNDPAEILAALGVEAARSVLLKEIRNVFKTGCEHVSYRHLSLLTDLMTNKGQIMSITRHGINRTDAGPLMKSTFEETCDILFSAAADCESDQLNGVAESVMLGTVAPMGTGVFDVLLDQDSL